MEVASFFTENIKRQFFYQTTFEITKNYKVWHSNQKCHTLLKFISKSKVGFSFGPSSPGKIRKCLGAAACCNAGF